MLASGSSGNSSFLATSKTRVLIDAGLSVRELTKRLAEIGETPDDLDAVLITHEHSDHIAGLARLVRARAKKKGAKPLRVFVSKLTAPQLDWSGADGKPMEEVPVEAFQAGSGWTVGDVGVESFTIPHDAVDPVGFCLRAEGIKIGIATDLGYMPDSIRVHLRQVQVLLLESNHDLDMLRVGPYPWSVKQRVMSRNGHLSNANTFDYLQTDLDVDVQQLVLGHLSEQNNHPEIVRMGAAQALERRGMEPKLIIAQQNARTEVFTY